jgi:hypothetical protein
MFTENVLPSSKVPYLPVSTAIWEGKYRFWPRGNQACSEPVGQWTLYCISWPGFNHYVQNVTVTDRNTVVKHFAGRWSKDVTTALDIKNYVQNEHLNYAVVTKYLGDYILFLLFPVHLRIKTCQRRLSLFFIYNVIFTVCIIFLFKSDLRGRMKKIIYCYYPPIACTILQYCQELILVAVFSYYTEDRKAGTILTAI